MTASASLLLHERYVLGDLIHEHKPWGAVYSVEDHRHPGQALIAKKLAIPPLRSGLDERLDALRMAVTLSADLLHPSRVAIVDFFVEDKSVYIIMKRVPGTNLQELLARGEVPPGIDWVPKVAIQVARGLDDLVKAQQYQALKGFEARMIMMTPRLEATLINLRFSEFLRPRGVLWEHPDRIEEEAEAAGIQAFGQVLYAMLTRRPWKDGQFVLEGELPESMQPVVLRCLVRSRPDAYKTFPEVLRDLRLVTRVLHQEKMAKVWITLEGAPPRPPPWQEVGVLAFIRASARLAMRPLWFRYLRLGAARKVAVGLLLLALAVLLAGLSRDVVLRAATYEKSGSVIYGVTREGRLLAWSWPARKHVATLDLGETVAAAFYSARTRKLYVLCPEKNTVMAVDPRTNLVVGTVGLSNRPTSMVPDPVRPTALCPGADATLLALGLQQLVPLERVQSDVRPVAALLTAASDIVLASAAPPSLRVLSNRHLATQEGWRKYPLSSTPRALRIHPASGDIWVLPAAVGVPILVVDAVTLESVRSVEVVGLPVDVQFRGSKAYVLTDSGRLITVDTASGATERSAYVGNGPRAMLVVSRQEVWVSSDTGGVVVVDPTQGQVVGKASDRGTSPAFLVAVP